MQSNPAAADLLADAVQALGLPPARAWGDGRGWQVAFGEASRLDVEWDAARGFVISADVGEVAEQQRLTMYEILLQYNFVWPETGGVRMALDSTTRQVVAIADIPTQSLTAPELSAALENMAYLKRVWMEIVRDGDRRVSLPER